MSSGQLALALASPQLPYPKGPGCLLPGAGGELRSELGYGLPVPAASTPPPPLPSGTGLPGLPPLPEGLLTGQLASLGRGAPPTQAAQAAQAWAASALVSSPSAPGPTAMGPPPPVALPLDARALPPSLPAAGTEPAHDKPASALSLGAEGDSSGVVQLSSMHACVPAKQADAVPAAEQAPGNDIVRALRVPCAHACRAVFYSVLLPMALPPLCQAWACFVCCPQRGIFNGEASSV